MVSGAPLKGDLVLKCPVCAAAFTNRDVHAENPFECPNCRETLHTSPWYLTLCALGAALLALLISILVGVGSWLLIPCGCHPVVSGLLGWVDLLCSCRSTENSSLTTSSAGVQRKPFDRAVSLHLIDKPDADKKNGS